MSVGTKDVLAYLLTEEWTIILVLQASCPKEVLAKRLFRALLLR